MASKSSELFNPWQRGRFDFDGRARSNQIENRTTTSSFNANGQPADDGKNDTSENLSTNVPSAYCH